VELVISNAVRRTTQISHSLQEGGVVSFSRGVPGLICIPETESFWEMQLFICEAALPVPEVRPERKRPAEIGA